MLGKSNLGKTVPIMGIDFINITKKDLLDHHLYPILNKGKKCFIVTANPEIVMRTAEDSSYREMVRKADYIVPDGAGIVLASRLKRRPIKERIPGFDLMQDLLTYANTNGLSCYFLGAKDQINKKAVSVVKRKYPNIVVAGRYHGYFPLDEKEVIEQLQTTNPDIIFVALGSPRQEKWITKNISSFQKGLFMGVGGSFDVLSGEIKRAPDKWIKYNLEWLYRLLRQPFRWKRTLKAVEFIIRIIFNKEKNRDP